MVASREEVVKPYAVKNLVFMLLVAHAEGAVKAMNTNTGIISLCRNLWVALKYIFNPHSNN